MKKIFGIVGAGGHGREIMPLARINLADELARGDAELLFVVEDLEKEYFANGHKVISIEMFLKIDGDLHFNIAIGNSQARERLSSLLTSKGCRPFGVIAGDVTILDCNQIGEGYTISPQTIITSNVTIGAYFQANCQCVISHDCRIGDFVTLAPGVRCNGNVIIEDHAYIGAGSVIINGANDKPLIIGSNSIIGMGSVVITNVDPYATVVGNPARIIRTRSPIL